MTPARHSLVYSHCKRRIYICTTFFNANYKHERCNIIQCFRGAGTVRGVFLLDRARLDAFPSCLSLYNCGINLIKIKGKTFRKFISQNVLTLNLIPFHLFTAEYTLDVTYTYTQKMSNVQNVRMIDLKDFIGYDTYFIIMISQFIPPVMFLVRIVMFQKGNGLHFCIIVFSYNIYCDIFSLDEKAGVCNSVNGTCCAIVVILTLSVIINFLRSAGIITQKSAAWRCSSQLTRRSSGK